MKTSKMVFVVIKQLEGEGKEKEDELKERGEGLVNSKGCVKRGSDLIMNVDSSIGECVSNRNISSRQRFSISQPGILGRRESKFLVLMKNWIRKDEPALEKGMTET